MLIQNNERISIGNIWAIFKDVIKDPDWFVKINPPRWMLNDYLNQDLLFLDPSKTIQTNRQLLDTFLYGNYAHMNRDHRARFKAWQDHKNFHSLKLQFLLGLKVILDMAVDIAVVAGGFLIQQSDG